MAHIHRGAVGESTVRLSSSFPHRRLRVGRPGSHQGDPKEPGTLLREYPQRRQPGRRSARTTRSLISFVLREIVSSNASPPATPMRSGPSTTSSRPVFSLALRAGWEIAGRPRRRCRTRSRRHGAPPMAIPAVGRHCGRYSAMNAALAAAAQRTLRRRSTCTHQPDRSELRAHQVKPSVTLQQRSPTAPD